MDNTCPRCKGTRMIDSPGKTVTLGGKTYFHKDHGYLNDAKTHVDKEVCPKCLGRGVLSLEQIFEDSQTIDGN